MDHIASYEQKYSIVRATTLEPPVPHVDISEWFNSAVNENDQGALQSFEIGAQGSLIGPIDQISTEGGAPAFTAPLAAGQVAVMNVSALWPSHDFLHSILENIVQHRKWSHNPNDDGSSPLLVFSRAPHFPCGRVAPAHGCPTQ